MAICFRLWTRMMSSLLTACRWLASITSEQVLKLERMGKPFPKNSNFFLNLPQSTYGAYKTNMSPPELARLMPNGSALKFRNWSTRSRILNLLIDFQKKEQTHIIYVILRVVGAASSNLCVQYLKIYVFNVYDSCPE